MISVNTEVYPAYITIPGEIQSDFTIKYTLDHEQYFYIKESLDQAYHKRAYIREYKRNQSKYRDYPVRPVLLLYMYESELLEPSVYYKQVQVQPHNENITLKVSLEHAYYIQEILQRRYNRHALIRKNRKEKNPDAPERKGRQIVSILITIPGQK